jgi:hypothetical protein
VGLRCGAPGLHDSQLPGVSVRLGGRAGQHPVGGEQVIDLAVHLHLAAGQQDDAVGDPL